MTRMPRGPKGEKRLLVCKFLLRHDGQRPQSSSASRFTATGPTFADAAPMARALIAAAPDRLIWGSD